MVTDTTETTDTEVEDYWRKLCDQVLMELVQQRLEEIQSGRS